MAKTIQLAVTARDRAGKGAARAVRRQNRVPGVIYGDKKAPQLISADYKSLWTHVQTGRFLSTLVDLDVDGATVRTIPRDIQFDPVRDTLVHVDFLRLGKGQRIAVEVPVHFFNHEEATGIKRGGALNVVRHEVELYCPAEAIPDQIEIDLTGLNIGDSVHISQIKLPDGVTPTITDRDFTIATIAGAGPEIEEEGEEEEVETEVIGEEEEAEGEGEED
jgi:large subunit ribosomal protein L25